MHNLFTRLPKDPKSEKYRRTKITRTPCMTTTIQIWRCQSEITQQLFLGTPLTRRVTTTTLCHWSTAASHRGLHPAVPRTAAVSRMPRPKSFSLVLRRLTSEIAQRPSLWTDFSLHASTMHPIAPALSVKARPPSLDKRRLTNNSAAAASSVSACAPCSSFNPLVGKPRRHNATRSSSRRVSCISLRLAEHSESVTMAFSLTLLCFGVLALSSGGVPTTPQQLQARTVRQHQNHHSTTSNMTSCARLTIATWSAHASKWSASTLVIKDATTSPLVHRRTPSLDNSSSTRAAARCFVILHTASDSASRKKRCHNLASAVESLVKHCCAAMPKSARKQQDDQLIDHCVYMRHHYAEERESSPP